MFRHSIMAEPRRGFAADTAGTTAIEYGLVASGIVLASISAASLLGEELASVFLAIWRVICPPLCVFIH